MALGAALFYILKRKGALITWYHRGQWSERCRNSAAIGRSESSSAMRTIAPT